MSRRRAGLSAQMCRWEQNPDQLATARFLDIYGDGKLSEIIDTEDCGSHITIRFKRMFDPNTVHTMHVKWCRSAFHKRATWLRVDP